MKIEINGEFGGSFSRFEVTGVDGYFKSVKKRGFTNIQHWTDDKYKLVGSVSPGNYGGGDVKPTVNASYKAQLMAKLKDYLLRNELIECQNQHDAPR